MSDRRKMQYVRLGQSGLKVSRIILGTLSYGSPQWENWVLEEDEGIAHIKAAYDVGIQTFDTADTYSNGESERILGKAIRQHNLPRDEIVVMTKVHFVVGRTMGERYRTQVGDEGPEAKGYVNQYGLSRKHIFDSVDKSLQRLQLDYIDVLQCHRLDPDTSIHEIMQALHDIVKSGKVRYIGMSSCWAYQFQAMQNYANTNNLTPFISMQNHYSLLYREEEREMMPTLKMFGVGSVPWSPLARGLLARPLDQSSKRGETDAFQKKYVLSEATQTILKRVEEIAQKRNISMAQVAVAWTLSKDSVCAPIIGTTKLENLYDIVSAVDVMLTDDEIGYLEEPYIPVEIIGHT